MFWREYFHILARKFYVLAGKCVVAALPDNISSLVLDSIGIWKGEERIDSSGLLARQRYTVGRVHLVTRLVIINDVEREGTMDCLFH